MTEAMITRWVFFAIGVTLIVFLSYRAWILYTSLKKKDKGDDEDDDEE